MVSTTRTQFEAFRMEQREKKNVEFFYDAFEKALSFYEAAPENTEDHSYYSLVLDDNFHAL